MVLDPVNTREHLDSQLTADDLGVTSIPDYLVQHQAPSADSEGKGASIESV